MMKKIILPLLTITLMLSPAYSYTDSFAPMQSDPLFLELLRIAGNPQLFHALLEGNEGVVIAGNRRRRGALAELLGVGFHQGAPRPVNAGTM